MNILLIPTKYGSKNSLKKLTQAFQKRNALPQKWKGLPVELFRLVMCPPNTLGNSCQVFTLFIETHFGILYVSTIMKFSTPPNGAFTLDVKSMLNEHLGGILSGTQC
jgi:hypothetical protein